MSKLMLMDAKHPDETRVVIVDHDTIEDFDFVTSSKAQLKGNIYLAKITRVEPSLQAAFVEYGGNKQGFLPFSEIHPDYYQIPTEDRQKLIEEEVQEAEREEAEEEAELEQKDARQDAQKEPGTSRGSGRGRRRGGRGRKREQAYEDEQTDTTTTHQAADSEPSEVASEPIEQGNVSQENEPEVETVSSDEAEERPRRRGSSFKRYRIQEVIKRNQIVLVQVIKEERGNKGCSLTTYISLAGRYCVLMPNSPKGGGVSRKISNGEQRRKLKEMLAELREKRGFSAIIRTAGLDRTKTEIRRDYEYLVKMWSQIREDTLASNAPSLIYEESDIIKRSIRDMYTSDIEQVLVQGADAYRDCKTFMKMIMPSHAPRIKEYKEDAPIFAVYGVEAQLASMYEPTVKMPSGGSIVIQATEALTSIDVNSGRSTTERNVEETAIKTNLEAAREVARQMRLRDVAGLVVVDFIDMYYGKNRRTLEKAMKDALKHDRAKIQVSRISPFGLMELSRQRLRPSIAESSTRMCETCQGTGFVKSLETVVIQIIRLLEREAVSGDYMELKVKTTPDAAMYLLNDKRYLIQEIEEQNEVSVSVSIESDIHAGHFRLYKTGEDGKEMLHQENEDERGRKRKSRGRRGGRNRRKDRDETETAKSAEINESEAAEESVANAQGAPSSDDSEGPRRKRGRARSRSRKAEAKPVQETTDTTAVSGDQPAAESETTQKTSERPKRGRRRASTQRKTGAVASKSTTKTEESSNEAVDGELKSDSPMNENQAKKASSEAAANPSSIDESIAVAPSLPEATEGSSQSSEAQIESHSNQPKRRGWWNRVVQGAENNA